MVNKKTQLTYPNYSLEVFTIKKYVLKNLHHIRLHSLSNWRSIIIVCVFSNEIDFLYQPNLCYVDHFRFRAKPSQYFTHCQQRKTPADVMYQPFTKLRSPNCTCHSTGSENICRHANFWSSNCVRGTKFVAAPT